VPRASCTPEHLGLSRAVAENIQRRARRRCPQAASKVLREYAVGRTGLLFATRDGKPLSQRNVLRSLHAAGATCGFHAFRRFRAETLRRERVPEDLVRFWLGHECRRNRRLCKRSAGRLGLAARLGATNWPGLCHKWVTRVTKVVKIKEVRAA
jgi:hypothetical protein